MSCPHGGGLTKVMEQAGAGLIFTILEQLELQPLPSVTVTYTVKEPELPAVTDTEEPVAEPDTLPLPVTLQLYILMPAGAENILPVELAHADEAPVTEQAGSGFTFTVAVPVLIQLPK